MPQSCVSDLSTKWRDVQLVNQGTEAYKQAGVVDLAEDKVHLFNQEFLAWGTHVSGLTRKVAAPVERRAAIAGAIAIALRST